MLSLRTSDRCHWCGNPPRLGVKALTSYRKSLKVREIATPACALARNDSFFFKFTEGDTLWN